MSEVMLDTNIVSALINDPGGELSARIAALETAVSVSVIVAAELRYGAAKRGSARLTAAVTRVLDALPIEPVSPPVDLVYGALRDRLERDGVTMGANDLLIAAHALTLGRALASHDGAFARVPGLRVEDWLA